MGNNIKQMLATYGALWCEAVLEGFKYYQVAYPQDAADHSKLSRASLIHDHMVAAAKRLLPDFTFITHCQRGVFALQDELVVQLKRLGHDMMPRNFPTPTSNGLYNDGGVEGLPGIPAQIPLITIGYVPDDYWNSPPWRFRHADHFLLT